jgi:uncharacterized protein YjbI with pentapeptide repeats
MERKKGDLLLSWQKKPVGLYLGGIEYYNFEHSMVVHISLKCLKVSFYTEDSFKCVDLRDVILRGADLRGVNLRGADLRNADLGFSSLSGADLTGANLRSAGLHCANLSGAYLRNANLSGAYLRNAYLDGANLDGANLRGANLSNIKYDESTVWPEGFKRFKRFKP